MPPKRRKLECTVCGQTMDSDYTKRHSERCHSDLVRARKPIRFKTPGTSDQENPFKGWLIEESKKDEQGQIEHGEGSTASATTSTSLAASGTSPSASSFRDLMPDFHGESTCAEDSPKCQDLHDDDVEDDDNCSSMISHDRSPKSIDKQTASKLDEGIYTPVLDRSVSYPTDPANFANKAMVPGLIREILDIGPCQPGVNEHYMFQKDAKGRSFHSSWYEQMLPNGLKVRREWLVYSAKQCKAFCFPCIMFAEKHHPAYEPTWCDASHGFCNWKKGTERIKQHETSEIHIKAACTMAMTQQRLASGCAINQEQLSAHLKTVEHNRLVLKRIIDMILYLSQQNMAFRGHREYSCLGENSVNEGNFLELCKLLAKYDVILSGHISPSNKQSFYLSSDIQKRFYLSSDIQNDLIKSMSVQVRDAILQKIKDAKYYSLIADETRDISRAEQLSLSLRFVNEEFNVEEAFMTFIEVPSTSAEYIFGVIKHQLEEWNIPMHLCRGQCYDGCANMAGNKTGVQERVNSENSSAAFVHCCAHNLTLALIDSCKAAVEVVSFFGTLERIYAFFTPSNVRLNAFNTACEERGIEKLSFKRLQAVRWSCRHQSVMMVTKTYPAILQALDKIQEVDRRRETIAEAHGLQAAMREFEFLLNLAVWTDILKETNILSKYLQSSNMDLMSASELVRAAESNLGKLRNDMHFSEKIRLAKTFADQNGEFDVCSEFKQRRKRKKKQMPGEQAEDDPIIEAEKFFMVNVYYKSLDILLLQLRERFKYFHDTFVHFSCLVPSNYSSDESLGRLKTVIEKYKDDICDQEKAIQEYKLLAELHSSWEKKLGKDTPNTVDGMLKFLCKKQLIHAFPNIMILMKIFLTIPASSACAERSFSRMKLIESYLRSSMSTERLSGLALLSIERANTKRLLNHDKVIENFAKMKQRKIILS